MNNFFTFVGTLSAAFGGVWFKDYLDNKKISKSTIKQKAIESYALSGRLIHSLNSKQVVCANLLKDKDFNVYVEIEKRNPDTSLDDLEKLELLIVENFYDLNDDFLEINKLISEQLSFLLNIIINFDKPGLNITDDNFKDTNKKFIKAIQNACIKMRKTLLEKYINVPDTRITICSCANYIIKSTRDFFRK